LETSVLYCFETTQFLVCFSSHLCFSNYMCSDMLYQVCTLFCYLWFSKHLVWCSLTTNKFQFAHLREL
jgi:hypothetical protein